MHSFVALSALVAIAWAEPVNGQQVKAAHSEAEQVITRIHISLCG